MGSVITSFRDVDKSLLRELKIIALNKGLKFGETLNEAVKKYIVEEKFVVKKKKSLLDLKPVDFGVGETNATEEIDKVVYR